MSDPKSEAKLIVEIGRRANRLGVASEFEASMVVSAVHRGVHALRLGDLFRAADHHFAHDIGGMVKHLDGGSLGGFRPRFCERKAVSP